MKTVYLWDEAGYYAGTAIAPDDGPFPLRSTFDAPPEPAEGEVIAWRGTWVSELPLPPPSEQHPDGPGPFLTQYAFDMRFTLMERVAIERAATVQPDMTEAHAITAVAIRVNLDRAKKATYINPQRAETRAGVMQFVALGLLTEARALEILDAPIQPHEVYRG